MMPSCATHKSAAKLWMRHCYSSDELEKLNVRSAAERWRQAKSFSSSALFATSTSERNLSLSRKEAVSQLID